MLARFRATRLLWPTLASLAGLAVLVSLGNWQMSRKAWKEELIARLAAGASAPPVPLAIALGEAADEPGSIGFRRVTVTGTLEHERELHLWAGDARGAAWSILTPLRLARPIDAGRRYPIEWALVIRGSVPAALKSAETRAAGQVAGEVTITGRIRLDEGRNWAAGAPDLARNEWYSRDLSAMRAHLLGSEAAGSAAVEDQAARIAAVFVEAEVALGGEGAPQPQLSALQLPNRHLEYALTWYGLALTLVGVFAAFARSRLRTSPEARS
ncbi:MAG: SURF1 family cytochrome oxidase biogenesis protein [Pseudomonadota bacterium]